MADFAIPTPAEIKQALAMLFGDDTEITEGKKVAPGASKGCQVAEYVNAEGNTVAACACDIQLAAFAGAALTMVPAATAEDAAKSGELTKTMVDNVYEVMNIISRYLMNSRTPHLKLGKMYDEKEIPDTLKQMIDSKAAEADFEISIPNYGSGNISILVT